MSDLTLGDFFQLFCCLCRTVSLLDSLDSTLENDKKGQTMPRTSGDMQTIPELTGERSTVTRGNSEDVGSSEVGHIASRRPSNTQTGFTLTNDSSVHSSNLSAKDIAGKTGSGWCKLGQVSFIHSFIHLFIHSFIHLFISETKSMCKKCSKFLKNKSKFLKRKNMNCLHTEYMTN